MLVLRLSLYIYVSTASLGFILAKHISTNKWKTLIIRWLIHRHCSSNSILLLYEMNELEHHLTIYHWLNFQRQTPSSRPPYRMVRRFSTVSRRHNATPAIRMARYYFSRRPYAVGPCIDRTPDIVAFAMRLLLMLTWVAVRFVDGITVDCRCCLAVHHVAWRNLKWGSPWVYYWCYRGAAVVAFSN